MPVVVEGRGHGPGPGPRRSPPERDQAPQRARRRLPARRATEEIEAELGPPGFIGPVGAEVPVVKDAAIEGEGYFAGANRADAHLIGVEPGRDFAFEELDVRAVEAGDLLAGGRSDRDRARDRGRQHLQARHPLLGAARRDLPRRDGQRAADRDGQLRDRPGADRRRRDRAGRRRARDRLAALARAVGGPPRRARQGRGGDAGRRPTASTRSSARRASRRVYDDRDAGPGEKLTDAELLGCPLRIVVGKRGARRGRGRGPGAAQRRRAPARRSATRPGAPARSLDGARLRRRRRPPKRRAVRHRSLGPAAARRPAAERRCARGRSRTWSATCASPRSRSSSSSPSTPATAATAGRGAALPRDHARRLRRRLPRPGDRPVQPHGRAARPGRRPAHVLAGAAVCWHFELLPRWALAVLAVRELVTLVSPSSRCAAGSTSRSTGSAGSASSWSSAGSSGRMVIDWWVIEAGVRGRRRARDAGDGLYVRAGLGTRRSRAGVRRRRKLDRKRSTST